jgi:hypothetical protein
MGRQKQERFMSKHDRQEFDAIYNTMIDEGRDRNADPDRKDPMPPSWGLLGAIMVALAARGGASTGRPVVQRTDSRPRRP